MRDGLHEAHSVAERLVKALLDADVYAYELRAVNVDGDEELAQLIETVNELTNDAKFAAIGVRAALAHRIDGGE